MLDQTCNRASSQTSARSYGRAGAGRAIILAGVSLSALALAVPGHAEPIQQQSDGDIEVTADSASGTPVAVELSSTGGSVTATVTSVTGSTTAGQRDYVVGLETLTGGNIAGTFGSITGTGEGELLGLGAESHDGTIDLTVGTVDVSGTATSGITARSVNGDIDISVETVVARGTGEDSLQEFYEAVGGFSDNGSVTIDVGSAESFGTFGSAIGAVAGGTATITADSATIHGANTVAVYARSAGDASVDVGTIVSTAETGQGAYLESNGGNATFTAGTITVGDFAQGARATAALDVSMTVGSITGGSGLRAESASGNIAITANTIDTWSTAISAQGAGGSIAIDAGVVGSKIAGANTIFADTTGDGSISIVVDQAQGIGVDRVTVRATTAAGDIAVTGGTVLASGNGGVGVFANSQSGDVTVELDHVATTGLELVGEHTPDGVFARSATGTASVTVGTATVEGYAASAVVAIGGAGASITADEASSAGQFAAVLYAYSSNGDATVDAGAVTLRGDRQAGVNALAGTGSAVVTVDSVIGQGTLGNGVYAEGGAGATVTSGTVDVERNGVRAVGLNGSNASITTTGNTIAGTGYGLYASGAEVSLSTAEGSTTQGATYGIRAVATDSATIVNGGTAIATGDLGNAIHVAAPGMVSITSNAVQVTGPGADPGVRGDGSGYRLEQGGIIVEGGAGPISIDAGSVEVAGEYRYGISARGSGAINITADTVNLASGDSVAVVARGGAGDVSITTGTVTTTGASGVGVFGNTTTGNIIIDAGTTRVENAGMQGGFTGDAVVATSGTGNISITSDDAFSAGLGGSAIVGLSGGNVAIDSGTAATTGDGGIAVYGRSYSGDVSIAAADTATSGDGTFAVYGRADAGDATIDVGTLSATGAGSAGAFARADAGTATISTAGDVTAAGGVALRGQGAAVVIETGEGTVTSGTTGILVNSTGTASVTNAGTVIGTGVQGSGIKVNAAGDVSIVSNTVTGTGDDGFGIYALSSDGNVTIDSASLTTSGDNTAFGDVGAIVAFASNGTVEVRVGDVTATGQDSAGVLAVGLTANVTVDGTVATSGFGILAHAPDGTTHVVVNGAVTSASATAAGVASVARQGVVEIGEGATVTGALGVALLSGPQGGLTEFYNSGTVHGTNGAAVGAAPLNPQTPAGSFYILNNGTLTGGVEYAVITDAGDDVLELTERSIIEGLVDLGDGDDMLLLAFNDGVTEGVGQVASTVNVEQLSVSTGSWLANGAESQYAAVAIAEGATLTIAENADGDTAIATPYVELNGRLNLDLATDTEAGDLTDLLIEGAGSLHLLGEATVLVDDASGLQYTGGTFVENGTLLLTNVFGGDIATSGDGVFELAAGGDFTGDLVNDGKFVFSRQDDYSFLGDFSGSGLLEKYGNGALTFAGLYAFEGTTSLFGGSVAFTGQLSEDTELDLTQGTIDLSQVEGGEQTIAQLSGTGGTLQLGETTLIIDQMGDTAFSGEILGLGTLLKDGDGDLRLNGDGTAFTGTGQVDGGTLSVNGDFSNADFVVNEGGTLGGAGTIGDTSVNGGTLAPGNSIDTLTVNGDVTFTAASVFEVEVDAAGNSDLLQATGTATLGGATVNVLAANGNYRPLTDYTILTAAGGVSGTFGSVQDNLAFLDPSLIYSANAVTLRLVRNDIDFAAFGATTNQAAIGGLIESFGYGNTLYDETLMLVDTDVAVSFASLTGEVYPAYGAAVIETAEVLRRQTADATQAGEGAYAWATGLYNTIDGGSGADGIELGGLGAAGGFGFAGGGFSASAGIGMLAQGSNGGQLSDGEVTFVIGRLAYSGVPGLSVSAGAQLGWVDGQTRRQTTLGTINQAVTGDIGGDYVQLFGEFAYRMPVGGGLAVEPFAGVSHVSLDLDNVTETGAATALAVAAINRDVTFADVGLRLSGEASADVRPYASAAYRAAWGDRASVAAFGFAGTPGTALVGAVPIAKSAAELSAGLVVTRGMLDFEVGYDATVSKAFDSHAVNAGFKVRF